MQNEKTNSGYVKTITKHKLFPFFVFSVCLHLFILFSIFYNGQEKEKFIQIPIDVSFFSPIETNNKTNMANDVPVAQAKEEIKQESSQKIEPVKNEIKEKQVEADSIKIAEKDKKKEAKKKEKIKKHKEKAKKEAKKEESVKQENNSAKQVSKNTNVFDTNSGGAANKGVMFDNANFKFSYYTTSIVKKIRRNWRWSNSYTALRAVIYFKINRYGDVIDTKIKESSGDEDFDKNALRAVLLSSPFAPLPESYSEKDLGVYFEFKFN